MGGPAWAPGCPGADNLAGLLLSPQGLLNLCCTEQYQGCCLHPLALSCGFCCWGKPVLGLAVPSAHFWRVGGNEGGLGLCCLSLGGERGSCVLRREGAQHWLCKHRVGGSVTPAPQLGPAASPTDPKCIVLMHCRNVCNVFKPCNRLNNRAAVHLSASVSLQHGSGQYGGPDQGPAALGDSQGLAGHSQGLAGHSQSLTQPLLCPPFINCCTLSSTLSVLGEPARPSTRCPAAPLLRGRAAQRCYTGPEGASAPRPPSGSSAILRGRGGC